MNTITNPPLNKPFLQYQQLHKTILNEDIEKNFKGITVHVVGYNEKVSQLFSMYGFDIIDNPLAANIVVFTGGADIHPRFYGEQRLKKTFCTTPERDIYEAFLYKSLDHAGQITIGICRGAQLLNVLNGGQLWQHVDNHGKTHHVIDVISGEILKVTSTHHQQMIPNFRLWNWDALTIGCDSEGLPFTLCSEKINEESSHRFRRIKPEEISIADTWNDRAFEYIDYEVLWFNQTNTLCFQPHPEYITTEGGISTCKYFQGMLRELVTEKDPFLSKKKSLTNLTDKLSAQNLLN